MSICYTKEILIGKNKEKGSNQNFSFIVQCMFLANHFNFFEEHLYLDAHRVSHLYLEAHRVSHLYLEAHRVSHLYVEAHRVSEVSLRI